MKYNRFTVPATLLLVFALSGIQAQSSIDLKGDYLGQSLPGDIPVIFAPGIVSDENKQHWAPRFSPDGNELFWWTATPDFSEQFHMTMRRVGDKWTAPKVSPFNAAPIYSTDGTRLYFGSEDEGDDISYAEKKGDSWGEPKDVGLVSRFPEIRFAYFPSIASDGTLYFCGYREGQWSNIGIYRSALVKGAYAKPELISQSVSASGEIRNWTPYIAPDQSYLIFCSTRGLAAYDEGDLVICFRKSDGSWTEPVSMGASINTDVLERFPALSPDGKYLFFTRDTAGRDEDVYWVSASIIEKLRKNSK